MLLTLWAAVSYTAEAASLRLSPGTGVYQSGATFTAQLQVVTGGDPINAAEGTLKFNPNELSVVAVNRGSSIFNLWVTEPTFSNTAGTISFSGGVPTGYTGNVGNVLSVTFRTKGAGSPRISFTNGSVLANDGRGTNVLTAMNGGTYTVQAATASPEPERIIEYVPPANTPSAPKVTSATHPDPDGWYDNPNAKLTWSVPAGVTNVRTLLDGSAFTIPTKVYDTPLRSIDLSDLDDGVSYFHVQFRNVDGWGKVTHYRLAVDTAPPETFEIVEAPDNDPTHPVQILELHATDATSDVVRFLVKIDDQEPYEFETEQATPTISLPPLEPGYHTVIVEALDQAGNSLIDTHSFTIQAFDRPTFTEVPTEMSGDVIPVIQGSTRPGSAVTVQFNRLGSEPNHYQLVADDDGVFTFIPDGQLYSGVYEISATAIDKHGAQSERSEIHRIAVQEPGYIRLGSQVVNAMSILVPLVLMTLLLLFGLWYAVFLFRRFRGVVGRESGEALDILHREFANLQSMLRSQETALRKSRKTKKLTKAEAAMIETFDRGLQKSQQAVEKEIEDVTSLTKE